MICKIRPIIVKITEKEKRTLLFAAYELQKYLSKVTEADFAVIPSLEHNQDEAGAIYIGIDLCSKLPKVENKELDDAICIHVSDFCGTITGNNARATLIAAYRYLKELGFAFLRPGEGGEYYPDELFEEEISVCEKASYRHRAICIEGSVFQKNLNDMIDWVPKAAMNGYFIQFKQPKEFFDRWYSEETPYRAKAEISKDDMQAIMMLAEDEIEKRSLLYHGVGHGWTSLAFGIEGTDWYVHEEPAEEYRELLAEVNGERKLWGGVPLNTNLCYSNPVARERVTDAILNYCKEHQNVSYLHFWLADGTNNNCECENCKGKRTSDYYVMMLNELDEKLTKAGLDTKIVFLVYVDLLWAPMEEKLNNKDRFVLMFAPISRTYSSSFKPEGKGEKKPYVLNRLEFPKVVADNIAYLNDWKKEFDGDSFDFDYHFMWDHYFDLPQFRHAQVLSEDIKNLDNIGLNGLVSCQIQRAFLPTCLNMNVMAETLWNKEADFDEICDSVLLTEFGEEADAVKEFLASLSDLGCPVALRGEENLVSKKCAEKLKEALSVIDDFDEMIDTELYSAQDEKVAMAWEKLAFFSELYRMMLELYLDVAEGKPIGNRDHIHDFAQQNEMRFKDEFDVVYFLSTFEHHIIRRLPKNQ